MGLGQWIRSYGGMDSTVGASCVHGTSSTAGPEGTFADMISTRILLYDALSCLVRIMIHTRQRGFDTHRTFTPSPLVHLHTQ